MTQLHAHSIEAVEEYFETNISTGLTPEEAQARLHRFGPNELREAPPTPLWRMLLSQFRDFLILILIVACLISFLLGEYVEGTAILAIVILNAVLSVVQESKAENALRALKKLAAPDARVLRDGHLLTISSRDLVPGDIVVLETGNYIPADVRLVESVNLRIDEASLTGESVPVEKRADRVLDADIPLGDRRNMAHMSTVVTYGRGRGLVVATGMETQIGRIAEMIESYQEEPTPLQVKLDQVGKWLGVAMLTICGVVFALGLLRNQPLLEMFFIAVSLAIAAVPEGLPAVVTIALAVGMQEMIRRNALIRKLPAVETLGSTTAICSDKTGTLTQNEMTAVRFYTKGQIISATGQGYQPVGQFYHNGEPLESASNGLLQKLLAASLLCNDAFLEPDETTRTWRMVGDPTEGALIVAAAKDGLWKAETERLYPRVAEIPFDSQRKRMTTIHRLEDAQAGDKIGHASLHSLFPVISSEYVALVKGAPDILLDLCSHVEGNGTVTVLDSAQRQEILSANKTMTQQALRVLGVAYRPLSDVPEELDAKTLERDLVFLGLIGMIDPARPEVRDAIHVARRAGIRTFMVTGDYKDTAAAIAQELDLLRPDGRVITGLNLDNMDDTELVGMVEKVDVFARVSPEHKVRIVEALKQCGHVVAMTGDGVNDAPALKRANIGVAMGIAGTDVSKETADMVLTDDNYASIVSAVEQGRVIYSNIRKFVYYLLSCNVAEIMIIFLATLFGWPVPLTAIQLLWLNLLTDGAPALALGLEKGDPDIMEQPPRPIDEPIINRSMVRAIIVQTVAISVATLTAFALGLRWFPGHEEAQTMAFLTLATSELFRAYTSRSERYPLLRIGLFSNRYMQIAVATSLVLLLAAVYLPFLRPVFGTVSPDLGQWAAITPLILLPAVVAEINKAILRRSGPGNGRPGASRRRVPESVPV